MGQRGFVPLYEYVCRRCSRAFEELVFGQAIPRSPGCAATDVDRVVSVGRSKETAPCGTCGDVRAPGACAMD